MAEELPRANRLNSNLVNGSEQSNIVYKALLQVSKTNH